MAGIGHRGFMGRKKEPVGLPFIFSVTVGSGQSFQLPTINSGTYDAIIDWGDGGSDVLTVWDSSSRNHTYASAGTYDISISGVFDGWRVNNYADRLKIVEVKQWGILRFGTGEAAFFGCNNLTITATDILDTSACTTFLNAFRNNSLCEDIPNIRYWNTSSLTNVTACFYGCPLFNGEIEYWDMSAVTVFGTSGSQGGMLYGCTAFTRDISSWNPSAPTQCRAVFYNNILFNSDISNLIKASTTSIYQMLYNCDAFDQSLAACDITGLTNATGFMQNATGLSTVNYDATLISWAAQAPSNAVNIHFGGSKYTSGGAAEAARTALISTYGWTITDGGAA